MYLIYVLILVYKIVNADDSNDTKYIDVLPAKEKYIVLDKIARRILSDVQTEDKRDTYNGEITDDQLQKHDAFVKQILKEESENLRRGNNNNKGNERKGKDTKHLDLTLRSAVEKPDEIPVVVQYTPDIVKNITNTDNIKKGASVEDIQIKKIRRNAEDSNTSIEVTTATVVSPKNVVHSSEMQGTRILHYDPAPKFHGSEEDTDSVENTSHATTLVTPSNISTSLVKVTSEKIEATTEEDMDNLNYITKVVKWSDGDSEEMPKKIRKFSDVSSDEKRKTDKNPSKDAEINISTTETSKTENSVSHGITSETTSEVIDSIIEVAEKSITPMISASLKTDAFEEKIISTSTKDLILEEHTNYETVNTSTTEINDIPGTDKQNLSDNNNWSTVSRNVFSKESESKSEENIVTVTADDNLRSEGHDEGFMVFEVDADNPFILNEGTVNQEQPYFVPVYNYEPNNAYFNAHNRLGPNEEDEELTTGNEKILRDEDKSFNQNEETIEQEQPYLIPVHNYAPSNAYYNAHNRLGPNEEDEELTAENEKGLRGSNKIDKDYYFDNGDKNMFRGSGIRQYPKKRYLKQYNSNVPVFINNPSYLGKSNPEDNLDYHFGKRMRTEQEFPGSTEQDHPFNSMGVGRLKSHMSAVRSILFGKSLYGSERIPDLSEKSSLNDNRNNPKNGYLAPNSDPADDISRQRARSIDYYLGRMRRESDGDNLKKVGYIKQNNVTRNVLVSEFPKDEVKHIDFDNQHFIKADYQVTPHTVFVEKNDTLVPMKRFWFWNRQKKTKPTTTTKFVSQEGKLDTIHKIINMTDEQDVFINLNKLKNMKVPVRIGRQDDVIACVNVLKDMVHLDDDGLKQYDWLGSTVDVQVALNKLTNLTESVINKRKVHPLDFELLNYIVYLHKASRSEMYLRSKLDINKRIILRGGRKRSGILKEINPDSRFKSRGRKTSKTINEYKDFKAFIEQLLYHLDDFHNAIKQISAVTTFEQQNWYENLKEIYFKDEKEVLSVILHLSTSRLFGLIEESSKHGLESDFIGYILKNENNALMSLQEFKFVKKVLNELD